MDASFEPAKKPEDVKKLIEEFLHDKMAHDYVIARSKEYDGYRKDLLENKSLYENDPDKFQEFLHPLRSGETAVRDNRFGNRINTSEKVNALIEAITSETFEDAVEKTYSLEGIGMDLLTTLMHIMNREKFHCLNGRTVKSIKILMDERFLPRQKLNNYLTAKTTSGLRGYIKTYTDYVGVMDQLQEAGGMTKTETDYFMAWLDKDMRAKYNMGDSRKWGY